MKLIDFAEVIEIKKGWSNDKKYKATNKAEQHFLLRITSIEEYEAKKVEFENMQKLSAIDIPLCQPIEFGICEEGVYSLQEWIEGNDAEEVMDSFSEKEKYAYGYEAGMILNKMHSIEAPEDTGDWESFFNQKASRKIENYQKCPLKYENGDAFITYIEENRHLLKNRPMTYQHGDYHVGNMMIDNKGKLKIIDFNRSDYGDPWEEFNRIVWCVQASPLFSTGMVDGYFNGNVPKEFWDLLALYISSNTLSSLPWAIPFGQEKVDVMVKQTDEILEWYDGMKNTVPKWYGGWEGNYDIF